MFSIYLLSRRGSTPDDGSPPANDPPNTDCDLPTLHDHIFGTHSGNLKQFYKYAKRLPCRHKSVFKMFKKIILTKRLNKDAVLRTNIQQNSNQNSVLSFVFL